MKKHRIFTIYMGNSDGANEINKYLEDGWLVKELRSESAKDHGCLAIVVIEKEEEN